MCHNVKLAEFSQTGSCAATPLPGGRAHCSSTHHTAAISSMPLKTLLHRMARKCIRLSNGEVLLAVYNLYFFSKLLELA